MTARELAVWTIGRLGVVLAAVVVGLNLLLVTGFGIHALVVMVTR